MTSSGTRFRDSAAVALLRGEGTGLETFLVRRGDRVAYMPGFDAFVGGKVGPEDEHLEVANLPERIGDFPPEMIPLLVACAIRETFEETGVLVGLAGSSAAETRRLEIDRDRLLAGEARFPDLARERGWRFDASRFLFAGRWMTPPFASMRFDTAFFAVHAPPGATPTVRPGELAEGAWVRPLDALDQWRRGDRTFAAPILWTLIALAEGGPHLAERLPLGPERSRNPVWRIELKWGIVLQPMKTKPLPPATHTNAYLVGEKDMVLIDPGSGDEEELRALFDVVDALEAEGRRLRLVLATHHHPDHVGGLDAVRRKYGVKVAAHADTASRVVADFAIADGERIPLEPGIGEWSLRAIHTPGHTRGHLCFLHERTGSLFTGDHVPGGRGTVIIDPPEGDMAAYVRSLERLLAEPVRTLFPGHGSPQGGAGQRIRGLLDHRLERERKVLAALGTTPRTPAELVPAAYDDTKQDLWDLAERSLIAHLLKLEVEGHATRQGDGWRLKP